MWRFSSVFRPSLWLLATAALSVVFPVHAINEGMRKRFELAEKNIHKLTETQAKKVLKEMQAYPLQPYLELEWLSKSLDDTNAVVRFMQEHQGTPLERTLRKRWLIYLADRKQAQLFLKNYQYGSDVSLDCKALEMRLVLEKPAQFDSASGIGVLRLVMLFQPGRRASSALSLIMCCWSRGRSSSA